MLSPHHIDATLNRSTQLPPAAPSARARTWDAPSKGRVSRRLVAALKMRSKAASLETTSAMSAPARS